MPQPPSFQPREHKARVGPVLLPAEGRQGDPPRWPASGRQTGAERQAWADLWHTPQAVAWERLGWTREVARYCRLLVASEKPGATAAVHAQATALADRLGLSPKAMRLLLWQVVSDEVTEQRGQAEASPVRERLRAVE
jgi:hypothetical protein